MSSETPAMYSRIEASGSTGGDRLSVRAGTAERYSDDWLDVGKTYRMRVNANVPTKEFGSMNRDVITSNEPVPAGRSTVRFEFAYDCGEGKDGGGTLFVNGKKVGEGRIEKAVPGRFGIDTFGVGVDTGSPVSNSYELPFAFNGQIEKLEVELR